MANLLYISAALLFVLVVIEAVPEPEEHVCGKLAHWSGTKCQCNIGCRGDPVHGCYLVSGTTNPVIRTGPGIGQVQHSSHIIHHGVNAAIAQSHAQSIREYGANTAGIASDMANLARTGAKFDATNDIHHMNAHIRVGQSIDNSYRGGSGGILTRVGPVGTYGRGSGGVHVIGGGHHCGVLAYWIHGACQCKPGCWGNPLKRCYNHCGIYAKHIGNACVCNPGYRGNPYSGCSYWKGFKYGLKGGYRKIGYSKGGY